MNKKDFWFLIGILLLELLNLIAMSGYAELINYTAICTYLSIGVLFFRLICKKKIVTFVDRISFLLTLICGLIILINILFNWRQSLQLTNFITLFGIVFWVQLFSGFDWNPKRFFCVGIASCFFSCLTIFLLLPGNVLSGWNDNSTICVFPVLLLGMACLLCSEKKNKHMFLIVTVVIALVLMLLLENRSSFLAFIVFIAALCIKSIYEKRKWFRVFYCTIIAVNVGFPYWGITLVSLPVLQRFSNFMLEIFDKSSLLNGRDDIWEKAILRITENSVWGTLGVRGEYYHNFSLDVLTQFGWMGWLIFVILLVTVLEKTFLEASKYNIFLVGFLCVLLLNTFENVFVCNNHFMVFSYLLLAVPLSQKYGKKYF